MNNLVFFICDQMLATSVTLPMELLRAAENMERARRKTQNKAISTITLASLDGKTAKTHTGLSLNPDAQLDKIDQASLVFLPALWRNPRPALTKNSGIHQWLQEQNSRQCTIAGVGTGCCFMADAGLLDHKPATTHWYYFDEFEKAYPKVLLKREHFITRAGNLFCTGSVTSLADLTIYFIQEIYGTFIARNVERHFFHQVRQAYSPSHNNEDELQAHSDENIAEAMYWMRNNYHTPFQIKTLADSLQMSLRTFNRRFKSATNITPVQYLQNVRMRNAKELIQTSNLSIAEIAFKCGYQDLAHFSSLFKKHFGATPGQYKTTVRAKLFDVT